MTKMELFRALGGIAPENLSGAEALQQSPVKKARKGIRRPLLMAALIGLSAILVGCGAAYAAGWFEGFFTKKGDTPLSDSQVQYIQENEQVLRESQTQDGWTVELKSTLCDGYLGHIYFTVTAPEGVDLEGSRRRDDDLRGAIGPGNYGNFFYEDREHPLMVPSTGMVNQEANLIWQCGLEWVEDEDQASNTMDLVVTVQADKANLHKPRGTANPFGEDVTFTICFANFVRQWEDPEVRKAIDERYAGQDYLIGGEELEGLHQGEILAEGIWEFDVQFHGEAPEILELVSEPVPVEAIVTRKVGEDPMRYTPVAKLETIPMTSFQLNSLGAETLFQETEDILNVAIETRDDAHFEPRSVTVVMKDGREIPLHTNLYSYTLAADTPIVLSQVDHVRLHDGTVLKRPGQ